MELLRFPRATVFAIGSATLLLAANVTPIHAQSGPDPLTVAQAYGELSVFVLNVAAGNDGRSREPARERAFVNAFAQPVLAVYPSLSADQQQDLNSLPQSRDEVRQTWPTLPVNQRRQIQQRWAAAVEDSLASVPCDVFDALARAYLLPDEEIKSGRYFQTNVDRLVQCWNDHPELAISMRDGRSLAAERAAQQGTGGDAAYVALMNGETTEYVGTMNMISIMSGSGDRWVVK